MDQQDLAYFRDLIVTKQKEALGEIETQKNNGSSQHSDSAYSFHMADVGTDAMEREKAFLFASREGNLLHCLDLALQRVDDGTFGNCLACGEEIGRERLEARPHTKLCITCKSKEEKRGN